MFVFPALNNNFKLRKRTFRCCEACRAKRTKCDITGVDFEVEGCGNCRKHGRKCSFIAGNAVKLEDHAEVAAPVQVKQETPDSHISPRPHIQRRTSLELGANSDMTKINIHYLQRKFNFCTSALHSDSAYQYVYHGHPVAIISANAVDNNMWRQSGVYVDLDPKNLNSQKKEGQGPRQSPSEYISDRRTYQYLLLIHAFTLASPEFDFTASEVTLLLEIYFFKINSVFPIVHEQRFWDDYRSNTSHSCMLYAMILVVLRDTMAEPILREMFLRSRNKINSTLRTLEDYTDSEFAQDLAFLLEELELKIRQVNLILPKLGDVDKLTKLVVQLLLSMNHRADRLGNEQSSHDLTAALNLAVSLAIHMKPVHDRFSQERQEYCANLWWCCFVFDRFNAVTNCRCLFMRHEDFNVDLPYSNLNLLRMVQLARVLENMLYAVFRPFDNIHMKNLNNDIKSRLEIFNLDEFTALEFDFCDKEIASNRPVFQPLGDMTDLKESLQIYIANVIKLMTRMINNFVILSSQKMAFDHLLTDNRTPQRVMAKAGANLLWYMRQLEDRQIMNIPMITWILSVTMASSLKVRANKITQGISLSDNDDLVPHYQLEDYLAEMEKYKCKWWIMSEIMNLTKDFLAKLELSSRKTADREFATPPPKRIKTETEGRDTLNLTQLNTPVANISRNPSLPSIQNMMNADAPQPNMDIFYGWDIARSITNEYDRFFESMHVDTFDNEPFKDVPNVINTL